MDCLVISSVLVVVIPGAVIAAIARAVLIEGRQPATAEPEHHGSAALVAAPAIEPTDDDVEEGGAALFAPIAAGGDDDLLVARLPARSGASTALAARSGFLLVLCVVGLGALTAAVFGALVMAGTALVDRALG